jgi:hypothetical protein
VVTNILKRAVPEQVFPELPSGMIAYLDRRFMKPQTPNLRVNYSSDRYLTDDEVRALPEFAAALVRDKTLREPVRLGHSTPQVWTVITIALLVLGPMAIWIRKSKRSTKNGTH